MTQKVQPGFGVQALVWIGFLICAAESFAQGFHGSINDLPSSAQDGWNATVFLESTTFRKIPGGKSHRRISSTGSGTLVARDEQRELVLVATSAHVVPCEQACSVRVRFRRAGGHVSSRARLLWSNPRMDLAILEARAPKGALIQVPRLATAAWTDGADGTDRTVIAIGFPDLALLSERKQHTIQQSQQFSVGHLLEVPSDFRADYFAYGSSVATGRLMPGGAVIHSAELLPGSSGGPLLDGQGRVIGINTGSLARADDSSCLTRATPDGPRCVHLAVTPGAVLEQVKAWRNRR